MSATTFKISGYWKDDRVEFQDLVVTSFDSTPEGLEDEMIFYYGITEQDIQNSCDEDSLEFVVTSYSEL